MRNHAVNRKYQPMTRTSARVFVYGPIPHPSEWLIAPDEAVPAGYLKLCSLSIAPRAAAKNPGSDLVPHEDIETLPSQLDRLLQAYGRLDDAGRAEVVRHAEQLGGIA
jgi:hypothetical protein